MAAKNVYFMISSSIPCHRFWKTFENVDTIENVKDKMSRKIKKTVLLTLLK